MLTREVIVGRFRAVVVAVGVRGHLIAAVVTTLLLLMLLMLL